MLDDAGGLAGPLREGITLGKLFGRMHPPYRLRRRRCFGLCESLPGGSLCPYPQRESGLAQRFDGVGDGPGGFAGTAYTGTGLCVPQRKPKGQTLTASAREYNRAIASRRTGIARVIAHLKNWKLSATGYRGRLDRIDTFLDAITKPGDLPGLMIVD